MEGDSKSSSRNETPAVLESRADLKSSTNDETLAVSKNRANSKKSRKTKSSAVSGDLVDEEEETATIFEESVVRRAMNEEESDERPPVDCFNHSKTGFPGAWTNEEYSKLLNAWEKAVEDTRMSDPVGRILELLKESGFKDVNGNDVWKKINTLKTSYKTYLGLQRIGIPVVKGDCVPQLQRILRKSRKPKRKRNRTTSTVSTQGDGASEDDSTRIGGNQSQQEVTDQNSRNKRRNYQRQNFQRFIKDMVGQQKTVTEYLQEAFKKIDESNRQIIHLLGQMVVALQKIPQAELN